MTAAVSAVSAIPEVRQALVRLQREWIGQQGGGVLEGRDIGTVVAPQAGVKVFLTASTGERARRRALETGDEVAAVEADIIRRDTADSSREQSPLQRADDAHTIDTTGVAIPDVVGMIVDHIRSAGII